MSSDRATPAAAPHWAVLVATAAALHGAHALGTHATAWHFFHDASRRLLDHGVHLYAGHPEFQFGPLSVALALPLTAFGESVGAQLAMVAASALGLLAFGRLVRAAQAWGANPSRRVLTAAGVLFVVVWADIAARTAHVDDAFALTATAVALAAVAERRPRLAVVALGLAAAAKPWAIAFAPLALVGARDLATSVRRLTVVGALAVVTWLPFLLGEPDTFDVTDFTIDNDPTSPLRALGFAHAETPGWARPAQLASGLAIATFGARTGRPHAVVLGAVAARLLLEPGANRYYTAGAVLGALAVELVARPGSLPWRSALLAVALELTAVPDAHAVIGRTVRLITVATALVVALRVRPIVPVSPARGRSPARAPSSSSSSGP